MNDEIFYCNNRDELFRGLSDDRFDDIQFGSKTVREWKEMIYGYLPKRWDEQRYEWNYVGFTPLLLCEILLEMNNNFTLLETYFMHKE